MKKRTLRKTSCISCRAEIANRYFASHKCKKTENIDIPEDLICPFCGSQSHNSGLYVIHVKHCKLNPDAKPKSEKWHQAMHNRKGKGTNHYTKAKETGIPYIISDETRKKISDSLKLHAKINPWDAERRLKHSVAMKNAVKENPDSYSKNNISGRVKTYEYDGNNLKGTWELSVAKWLDFQSIVWEYESKSHKYIWNNDEHLYFPDFFLPEYNAYIEVKGFKTERDDAKWTQFNDKLIIIDNRTIYKLNEIDINYFLKRH